jgi:CcmD family protein
MINKYIKNFVATKQNFIFSAGLIVLSPNPVNDFMRSIGKIWVVVASLLIIFVGIVVFLYFVERRISKLENELDNEQEEH